MPSYVATTSCDAHDSRAPNKSSVLRNAQGAECHVGTLVWCCRARALLYRAPYRPSPAPQFDQCLWVTPVYQLDKQLHGLGYPSPTLVTAARRLRNSQARPELRLIHAECESQFGNFSAAQEFRNHFVLFRILAAPLRPS